MGRQTNLTCPQCDGHGTITVDKSDMPDVIIIDDETCPWCKGSGEIQVDLDIPQEQLQLALGILAGSKETALVAADRVLELYHGEAVVNNIVRWERDLAKKEEREACAQLVEQATSSSFLTAASVAQSIARIIRERCKK